MNQQNGQDSGEFRRGTGRVLDGQWARYNGCATLVLAVEVKDKRTGETDTFYHFMRFQQRNSATGEVENIGDEYRAFRLADLQAFGWQHQGFAGVEKFGRGTDAAAALKAEADIKLERDPNPGPNGEQRWRIKSVFRKGGGRVVVKDDQKIDDAAIGAALFGTPAPSAPKSEPKLQHPDDDLAF